MTKRSLHQQLAEEIRKPETIAKLRSVVDDALAAGEIDAAEAKRLSAQIDAAEARGQQQTRREEAER
jgi:hypothetical protein